jgi:hypothetical protein
MGDEPGLSFGFFVAGLVPGEAELGAARSAVRSA